MYRSIRLLRTLPLFLFLFFITPRRFSIIGSDDALNWTIRSDTDVSDVGSRPKLDDTIRYYHIRREKEPLPKMLLRLNLVFTTRMQYSFFIMPWFIFVLYRRHRRSSSPFLVARRIPCGCVDPHDFAKDDELLTSSRVVFFRLFSCRDSCRVLSSSPPADTIS